MSGGAVDRAVRNRTWLVLLLALVLYVPFNGMRDLWYPDEPDIGEVAQKMYESGDLVAPRRNGTVWVDYPPMLYWVGCGVAFLAGGVGEWSLRMASALGALALLWLVLRAGARWFGAEAALWSALALLTMVQFAYNAVSYRPDVLFTLGFAGGLLLYAEGVGERARAGPRIAGFALFGFAVLAKGVLGLLLPGLILVLYHGSRREWRRILALAPLSLVSLALYLPWFVACGKVMVDEGLSAGILTEVWEQNCARFLSGEERGHGQPLLYYVGVLWADLAPWSLFLPLVAWQLVRDKLWREPRTRLLVIWALTSVAFLSLAATKRQVYLLVAYPAFALLIGRWLAGLATTAPADAMARAARVGLRALAVILGAAGLAALASPWILAAVLAHKPRPAFEAEALTALAGPLRILGVVVLAAAAWLAHAAWARGPRSAALRLAAAMAATFVVVQAFVLPAADPLKTYAPAGRWLRAQLPAGERHVALHYLDLGFHKMGAFAYELDGWIVLTKSEADIEAFFADHPDSLCVVAASELDPILASTRHDWRTAIVRDDLIAGRRPYVVLRAPSR
ncbi:MAG: glycosyltransferase family 39 protein [Planctomycetota bacterium]